MWVQTLAPDRGTDPSDASRVGGHRGLLLHTNASEKESPDALPCSGSGNNVTHAAGDFVSYAAPQRIPCCDEPSSTVSDRSVSWGLL